MKKARIAGGLVIGLGIGVLVFACGGDDSSSPPSGDDGGNNDGTTAFDSAPSDSAPLIDSGKDGGGPVTCTVSPCAIQISQSYLFGCAVMSDHTVECWGSNSNGQNGGVLDGSVVLPNHFATGHAIAGLTDVVQVSAGFFHACALTSAGAVYCWGDNQFGEVGTTIVDGGPGFTTPTLVNGITGTVVSLSVGGYFSCALLADHTATCWGLNSAGELATGTYDASTTLFEPESISTPTPLGLTGISTITTGDRFSCSLLADGGLECVGSDNFAQLGSGTLSPSTNIPGPVEGIAEPITALGRAQGYSACVIVSGGNIRCWGDDQNQNLGYTDAAAQVTAKLVPNLTDVVEVGAGAINTCVRTSSGSILCLGDNEFGGLGPAADAATTRSPDPVAVPVTDVVQISVGHQHVCVLQKSGAVVCWGDNTDDSLGRAADAGFSAAPLPVVF